MRPDAPGLYVHVPFCEALCAYCDFYSVKLEDARRSRFVEALHAEAELRAPTSFAARTVFIGGGTPTALEPRDLQAVLGLARSLSVERGGVDEWTVECNPGSLTPEKAEQMRAAGVTRLSVGVQSFDDAVLESVGRIHDAATARRAIAIARESGIEDVSIDLLFAVPGQGVESFRRDLEEVVGLGLEHVSAYALIFEPGTPLARQRDLGRVRPEEPETELEMMRLAARILGAAGLARYEVSSFALPGRECRHNLNYWRNGSYLGLGPAAASYLDGERVVNARSWRRYEQAVLTGRPAIEQRERLEPRRAVGEELMLRLRTAEGASLSAVSRRWSVDAAERYGGLLERLGEAGLVRVDRGGDHVTLTERGVELSDAVLGELLAVP